MTPNPIPSDAAVDAAMETFHSDRANNYREDMRAAILAALKEMGIAQLLRDAAELCEDYDKFVSYSSLHEDLRAMAANIDGKDGR